MQVGLTHIYCGDGKGKTTAAVGLAVRAAGAGMKVCFAQFMKTGDSSELSVLKSMKNIELMLAENHYGFTWKMTAEDREKLKNKNNEAIEMLMYDKKKETVQVIILDEIISAYQNELVDKARVLKLIDDYKGKTELVLTGRNPAAELFERADYITEMKCERHPYEQGISARMGIEL